MGFQPESGSSSGIRRAPLGKSCLSPPIALEPLAHTQKLSTAALKLSQREEWGKVGGDRVVPCIQSPTLLFKSQWEKPPPHQRRREKQPIKHSPKSCSVWLKSDKLSLSWQVILCELSSLPLNSLLGCQKKDFEVHPFYLKADTDHKGVQPPQKNIEKQVPEICCTPQCLQLILRYSAPKKFTCRSHIEHFHQQKRDGKWEEEFKETLGRG